MINHIWSVLCKESKIDAENNTLSLHDVLEEIQIEAQSITNTNVGGSKGFKFFIPFEITSLYSRDHADTKEALSVLTVYRDPSGVELSRNEHAFVMSPGMFNFRTRMKSPELALTKESGRYSFEISIKQEAKAYKTVVTLPLQVKLAIREP